MNKAIFLDRDDTVIPNKHYLDNVEGVELLEGAGELLYYFKSLGYQLVLVTNQSGISRGYFDEAMVHAQYDRLQELLSEFNVTFDLMKFCPHAPEDNCNCRKPSPNMLLEAALQLKIDLAESWMIGDKDSDVGAGINAGTKTIYLNKDKHPEADFSVASLGDIHDIIKS